MTVPWQHQQRDNGESVEEPSDNNNYINYTMVTYDREGTCPHSYPTLSDCCRNGKFNR